jgi:hypothetical protein
MLTDVKFTNCNNMNSESALAQLKSTVSNFRFWWSTLLPEDRIQRVVTFGVYVEMFWERLRRNSFSQEIVFVLMESRKIFTVSQNDLQTSERIDCSRKECLRIKRIISGGMIANGFF